MANAIAKPEIWAKELLAKINKINVALNFVNPALTDEVLEMGDKVHVITPGSVSTGTYTKGTDVTVSDITDSDEYLQITDNAYWAFDVDDIDRVQANPAMVGRYMEEGGKALSRAIDSYILAAHANANAANKIAGASNAAIKLSVTAPYSLLVDAAVALGNFDVPMDERWIVVNPYTHGVLLKDTTNFIRASALGDLVVSTARFEGATAANTPGFVGQIAGFDVYVSSNLPTASGKTYLVFGQGKPIDYVSQLNKIDVVPLARQFGVACKQLVLHGKKVFAENAKRLGSIYVENA